MDVEVDEQLLRHVQKLARKMLMRFPHVKRWNDTDDVASLTTLKFVEALKKQREEGSNKEFHFRIAQNVRWVLLDLAKKYRGPYGLTTNHDTHHGEPAPEAKAICEETRSLERWAEFHEAIDSLPDSEREVFDLLWYSGRSIDESAKILKVSRRTICYRRREARISVAELLDGCPPSTDTQHSGAKTTFRNTHR